MAREQSCWTGPEVIGMDVSTYQTVDWDEVARNGEVSFVIMRVADGMHVDRKFMHNWREAGRVGIPRGFYHYFRPIHDGRAQAKLAADAVKAAGGMNKNDLPPALDIECKGFLDGGCSGAPLVTPDKVVTEMKRWLSSIKSRLWREPMIYTGGAWVTFAGMYPDHADAFSNYKLWRPAYNTTGCVPVPPGFKAENVVIQQYTSSGRVQGVQGPGGYRVDLNAFRGNHQDLANFAKGSRSMPWWVWAVTAATLGTVGAVMWRYGAVDPKLFRR
jgi:lysozyme